MTTQYLKMERVQAASKRMRGRTSGIDLRLLRMREMQRMQTLTVSACARREARAPPPPIERAELSYIQELDMA